MWKAFSPKSTFSICWRKMPINIRPKPAQSKLSAGVKSSSHAAASSSHSRFSKSPKGNRKQTGTSTPGCRSGLEPGSVFSGVSPTTSSKSTTDQHVGFRTNARSKPAERTGRAASGGARGSIMAPSVKTMSMENIQSLSAAYATSGTMYPSEQDSLQPSGGYPERTMTLGRSTSQFSSRGRSRGMGSSPNITTSGLHHSSEPDIDQHRMAAGTESLWRQSGRYSQTLDCDEEIRLSNSDFQNQVRELQKENDCLRRELDEGREVKSGTTVNSVNFWCPEGKREKGARLEDRGRTVGLKDQYRTDQDDVQVRQWFKIDTNVELRWDELVVIHHQACSVSQWWKIWIVLQQTLTALLWTSQPFVSIFKVAQESFLCGSFKYIKKCFSKFSSVCFHGNMAQLLMVTFFKQKLTAWLKWKVHCPHLEPSLLHLSRLKWDTKQKYGLVKCMKWKGSFWITAGGIYFFSCNFDLNYSCGFSDILTNLWAIKKTLLLTFWWAFTFWLNRTCFSIHYYLPYLTFPTILSLFA